MALQASGSISFSEIANEFGLPLGRNLGSYRNVNQNVGTLTNLPLDVGIPQSGPIGFSSFYSKKLNVVVDLYSIPNNSTRLIARSRYNNNNLTVIGGFRGRPESSAGIRVIVNINGIIGSNKSSINNVALMTGTWEDLPSPTQLELEIGADAQIIGAGGNGGNGPSGAGSPGSSALGIQYPSIVRNRGYIQAGGGGGGGSIAVNAARRSRTIATRRRTDTAYGGNGGGGGGGIPIGLGGAGGPAGAMERRSAGVSGSNATDAFTGGAGGNNDSGQVGGAGGSSGGNGGNGGGAGANGGSRGRAIIIFNDGTGTSITNIGIGSAVGPIVYNTAPT